jgi:hypothetical protein
MNRYCYHITNGTSRAALVGGTVTANSMEAAAEEAARRSKLTKQVERDELTGRETCRWVKDGQRRSVYVLHDPSPITRS